MLTCIFCNRPLSQATVMLAGNAVGPTCARRHNLIGASVKPNKQVTRVKKPPKQKSVIDKYTRDLFSDER